jgi:lipopolysaccharide transport system permease protein
VTASMHVPEVVLRPMTGWRMLGLGDIWQYRELVWYLAARDLKVRYKQTALGAIWAVFQPVATVLVFTVIFGGMAGISSEGVPYAVFCMAGLLPWNFFAAGLNRSAQGLLGASGLISKVYFPRLAIPLASVAVAAVDLAFSGAVLVALLLWYQQSVTVTAFLVVPLLLIAFAASLGFGLLVSALTVRYRDLVHALPFLTQLWFFITPVIYPGGFMQNKLQAAGLPGWLAGINPMVGVVTGFRSVLFGSGGLTPGLLVVSSLVAAAALLAGAFLFRRVEATVVDTI